MTYDLQTVVEAARVDDAVYQLRPDYRVALLAVGGIAPRPSDESSEAFLQEAEAFARALLRDRPVEDLPHVAAWREAFRAFGAKPQRTRNSLEALLRRAAGGLPRVNLLTDIYNAVSVLHQIPLGGEDLARYRGAPQLVRAIGDENFDTMSGGESIIENPAPGEVVWRDDEGVTCRRWNWRQGRRTQLTDSTTTALFILDALGPLSDDALVSAADDLARRVQALGADVRVARRVIARSV